MLFEVPTTEPTQQVHTTTKLRNKTRSKRSETTAVARKIARKKATKKASRKVSVAELPEGETRSHRKILEQRYNEATTKGKNYHLSDELDMREVILLDSQSTMDIFCNRNLVANVLESSTTLTLQSNGGSLKSKHVAEVKGQHFVSEECG